MLNQALKTIRQFHKLNQSQLAESLNVSTSHISEIETGKNTITLEMLKKYSVFFDIPVSHIMFFSEQLENEDLKSQKVRRFLAKKVIQIMDWVIARDEKKNKNL